jgi:hypothetical protein
LPRGHPCATREYRESKQKALVDYISGPWMLRFGQPMIDVILRAGQLEGMGSEDLASLHRFDV